MFGLTLGLAFLTKYIAIFLAPTYFLYLITARRDIFKNKQLYWAGLLAIIIFSPVIVYNIYDYKTFGHFDLQLSYILKQKTPWNLNELSGKTLDPFSKIGENLPIVFSPPFLIVSALGLILAIWKKEFRKQLLLILLAFLFITLLLVFTGSAIRFVALYIIPFTLFSLTLFIFLWDKKPIIALTIFAIFMAHELFFTAERIFINPPDYGVVKLDQYFDAIFKNGRPSSEPNHPNPVLDQTIKKYSVLHSITLEPTGLIYDDNLALGPMLWLFSRRQYYHGIPIMPASNFDQIVQHENPAIFNGFTLYFVKAGPGAPLKPTTPTSYANQVEKLLAKNNKIPDLIIKAVASDAAAFSVYKFSIHQ